MQLLSQKGSPLFSDTSLREKAFFSLDAAQLHLPFAITDYTDFFSSKVHAINVCQLAHALNILTVSLMFHRVVGP